MAWGCQAQEPQGLQAYEQRENVIALSGVSDEPFRRQAVQPQSSNSNHLWQSHQPLVEGVAEDCCWILQVLPRLCRRGFGTNFEGWNLALPHCLACALQHFPMSCRDSAGNSHGRCVAGHCCSVPRAIAVPVLDRYQTIEAQMAANLLGGHDSAYAIPV